MVSIRKRVGDRSQHIHLFRALLEGLKITRERSTVFQYRSDFLRIERNWIFRIGKRREFRFVEPHAGIGIFLFDLPGLDAFFGARPDYFLEDPGGVPFERLTQADNVRNYFQW